MLAARLRLIRLPWDTARDGPPTSNRRSYSRRALLDDSELDERPSGGGMRAYRAQLLVVTNGRVRC